ncbi:MAG: START domain-containing protein [Chitinophagales bacterium]
MYADLKFYLGVFLTSILLIISNGLKAQENWELAKENDGIKVFTRTSKDSNFKDAKALADINASLDEVLNLLMDVKSHKSWMDRIEVSDLVEHSSDSNFVVYYQVKAPWPVSNRDVVSHYIIKRVARNKVKLIVKGRPEKVPEKEGLVRIKSANSVWEILENENGRVSIVLITQSDPGGNIPAWLANSAASDNPYKTLMGLKAKVED